MLKLRRLARLSRRDIVTPRGILQPFVSYIALRRLSQTVLDLPLPIANRLHKIIIPYAYSAVDCTWKPWRSVSGKGRLEPGKLLRIVSWNINFEAPHPARRANAAVNHLEEIFGILTHPLVIMLQEVNRQSLDSILPHPWIRANFVMSNAGPLPQRYFTLLMVSRHLQARTWFRVPFPSEMERDALVVDIPISSSQQDPEGPVQILRLCTTHLESLQEAEGNDLRHRQLAHISALLKAPPTAAVRVIGGLVGGDMNSISTQDENSHRFHDVNLRDAWEDAPPSIPSLHFQEEDPTFGRSEGHTWGYQPSSKWRPKRLDRFLYTATNTIDVVRLQELTDLSGKIGRLGVGLKAKEGDESDSGTLGKLGIQNSAGSVGITPPKDDNAWVSDHFGIAIGIKVLE